MTSLHPSKRQFVGPPSSQQSITSYFSSTPSFLSADYSSPSPANSSITYIETTLFNASPALCIPSSPTAISPPALPANVQSNLLSVGMRVRKSIPEGYKTGTYSAFALFSESPVSPRTPVPYRSEAHPSGCGEMGIEGTEKKVGRARARELTPFCGILRVGGFAVQDMGMDPGTGSGSELDECPPLSSQGSTGTQNSWVESLGSGNSSGSGNSNKRRWEFEEEEEEAKRESYQGGENDTGLLGGIGKGFLPNRRTIAVPRKMKASSKMTSGCADLQVKIMGEMGQEVDPDVDFGEADFLDYRLVGGEVEMCDA